MTANRLWQDYLVKHEEESCRFEQRLQGMERRRVRRWRRRFAHRPGLRCSIGQKARAARSFIARIEAWQKAERHHVYLRDGKLILMPRRGTRTPAVAPCLHARFPLMVWWSDKMLDGSPSHYECQRCGQRTRDGDPQPEQHAWWP